MKSKRPFSNSSEPISPVVEEKRDVKHKGLEASPVSKNHIENDVNSYSIERLRNDPAKIEAMTIQELRKTLRSIWVPAKGCKDDLVSALKSFMDNNMCGQDFPVRQEQGLFISSENTSVEVKAKRLSDEESVDDISNASEISGFDQGKKRLRQPGSGSKTVKVVTKKKLSVKSDKASEFKTSRAKRSAFSDILGVVEQVDGVSTPTIQNEPWTVLAHKKPQKGWIAYNPRTMRPPPLTQDTNFFKILSWNVNGLRALLKLEGFSALQLAQREDFDVLCLQETKLRVEYISQFLP